MRQPAKPPPAPKGNRIVAALEKAYERFVKIRGNPREIALGFALGLFIGMTPYMGLHMAISVFLAALFKWNKIAAGMGAWISNPVTAPVIYSATFYAGEKILNTENACCLPTALNLDVILQLVKSAPEIFWILTVGGIVLGIPVAVLGYCLALATLLRYRERIREKIVREKEKLGQARNQIKKRISHRKRRP
jgi:hypothetical protein